MQDKVNTGEVEVRKVKGGGNRADALTKHVDQKQLGDHARWTGQAIGEGRLKSVE